jgi:P27 family predicted phage terminase small subunit
MGKRGPKPKPTRLRLLEGNPGGKPTNSNEPQPTVGVPRCPKKYEGDARKLWKAIGDQLAACGILTKIDSQAFELLIDSYVEYLQATEKVSKTGPIWLEKGDSVIPKFAYSPYWVQANRAGKRLHVLLREFGMTPSARSAIKSAAPIIEHSSDPAARYFA